MPPIYSGMATDHFPFLSPLLPTSPERLVLCTDDMASLRCKILRGLGIVLCLFVVGLLLLQNHVHITSSPSLAQSCAHVKSVGPSLFGSGITSFSNWRGR